MMKRLMWYWLSILAGYISGSILFGFMIPKLVKKIDVCSVSEDGNPGTYNAFKYGGFWCGVAVLLAELLKGALPIWLCGRFLGKESVWFSLAMVSPVLGHACSAFHHGRGGKAIAASFGVMIGLFPEIRPLLILIVCYLSLSFLLPQSGHGIRSIAAYLCFCAASLIFVKSKYILFGSFLIAGIVIYKHVINGGKQKHESTDIVL